jgi:hypothetical protein
MLYLLSIPLAISILCYTVAAVLLHQQLQRDSPLNRMPAIISLTLIAVIAETLLVIYCFEQMDAVSLIVASYTSLFIDAFTISAWLLSVAIIFFRFQEPIVNAGTMVFVMNIIASGLCYADKLKLLVL